MVARKRYTTTPEAYQLLQDGAVAHAEIMHTGVRVDKGYLDKALADTARRIIRIEEELKSDPIYRVWRKRYGENTKLSAPEQLAGVMFEELGYKPKAYTTGGKSGKGKKRGKADEASFEGVTGEAASFVKNYFRAQKLRKGRGTYLKGIQREMVEQDGMWFVHPSYNLNTVATFRSSCDNPNWQNVPTRNKMLAEMVRRSYIPLPGYQFVEIDYSQVEVKVAVCYNHDQTMYNYVTDPKSDMHRDMAARLFFLDAKHAKQKDIRHLAKNKMVFPQFYGDFYIRCAKNIWDAIGFQNVKLGDSGPSLYEHLASKGIRELGACDPGQRPVPGTFEHHVKSIEDWMWGEWFKGYAQWKRDYYAEYLRTGGFQMHTGFAINGDYAKNDVTNYPIQGSAFHCLLYSLPRIIRRLKRYRMRSRVVGQIHDCVVGCVHPREREDYIHLVREVMVEEVAKAFKSWLIVPLEVEPEVCPIDAPWFNKMAMVERDGRWEPGSLDEWSKLYGDWSLQL